MQERTVAFSKDSSNLFFHILTKCNLSCRHCYINKEQHGDNTLDIETIKNWLNLFSNKNKQMNLIFLGGEPTLHPDLPIAVKYAKKIGYKSITIDTNGYLFHDILDKITCDEVDFISFSLDGATKKTNDSIRGEGSYDQCLAGINEAKTKGFSTSMIYTVSKDNIDGLSMMPDLVKNLNIKRFFIQVIGIRGESSKTDSSSNQVSKI
ncbi:MAG: radical SAM protein, partial [Desulfobacteraceae bacterium]|nr:radical SAM protein [Desulfobacteraceae bacterium]